MEEKMKNHNQLSIERSSNAKAVHFGAGNIGRGFIGMVLSEAGYKISFVVRNEAQADELNRRGSYPVSYATEGGETVMVNNVTAILNRDREEVSAAIAEAELVTTAVGAPALKHIAPAIAEGIQRRMALSQLPLQVIACENAINASSELKEHVYAHLDSHAREMADEYVVFSNTAVDRIVPGQNHEDPLEVTVEPYFEWVVQRPDAAKQIPMIKGVRYVDKLEPYIERKLFTVNTAHCCAAYFGYLQGCRTVQEVLSNPRLRAKIEAVLKETGALLTRKYNWDEDKHRAYIHKIINRFTNSHLTDKVVRVGRSPIRKLSFNERLVRPVMQAYAMGLEVKHLVSAIAAAMLFDYGRDAEANKLQTAIRQKGLSYVIAKYMRISENHPIHQQIKQQYKELQKRYPKDAEFAAASAKK